MTNRTHKTVGTALFLISIVATVSPALGQAVVEMVAFQTLDADCNGNGIADTDDIAGGTSADCNTTGVPDECEVWPGVVQPTYPVPLNSSANLDSRDDWSSHLMTDGLGNWVAVWSSDDDFGGTIGIDSDILLSRSTDNGATWTYPEPLNGSAEADGRADAWPQLATDGLGNWVAVWSSNYHFGATIGNDFDIMFALSTDNGATWTYPEPLNGNAGVDADDDLVPQLTTDGLGNWVAVWYSYDDLGGTIGTDRDILFARSANNGVTWTAPEPLNANADVDTGSDYNPQLTTDGSGSWIAVWYSSDDLGGTVGWDYDILFARSTDNGVTWTNPAPLNTNAGVDSVWDDIPQVTTDRLGNWVAVWRFSDDSGGTGERYRHILFARSSDNGITWTDPELLNANSEPRNDIIPEVTTDGSGIWVAVWNSLNSLGGTIGTDHDILLARSVDNGATWTDPEPLNPNADEDSGYDYRPTITTDGSGNWMAVWTSTDDLGGTIGTDGDILISSFRLSTAVDCNLNGAPDVCDLADGTSIDCNANSMPDECEPDCNANGIADMCDLSGGTSADCDENGTPDECEPDCNANEIPDTCDLATGFSIDCNLNGTPDECELDCNANEIPDTCDLATGFSVDCNLNGTPDECDLAAGSSVDCDGNSVPDECDLSGGTAADCNANSILDMCDVTAGTSADCDNNGTPDECEPDCNANGIVDMCDVSGGTSTDCDENGTPDECQATVFSDERFVATEYGGSDFYSQGLGRSVVTRHGLIVSGIPSEMGERGGVYVFRKDSGEWVVEDRLISPHETLGEPVYRFGASIALADDTIFVSEQYSPPDHSGLSLFRRRNLTWEYLADLQDIVGQDAYIAPPEIFDGDDETVVFRIYYSYLVLHRDPQATLGWSLETTILPDTYPLSVPKLDPNLPPDSTQEALPQYTARVPGYPSYRHMVAVSGDTIAIPSAIQSGGVRIHRRQAPGDWTREALITTPTPRDSDNFGRALSLSGDVLVVGAYTATHQGVRSGAAYVYRRKGTTWILEASLYPPDPGDGDHFGNAVDIDRNRIVVGAMGRDETFVYMRQNERWVLLVTPRSIWGDHDGGYYGFDVALDGDLVVVGAPNESHAGAVYAVDVRIDCNANGLLDICDIGEGNSYDVDSDGVPDECQSDCNNNGLPDLSEIEHVAPSPLNSDAGSDTADASDGIPQIETDGSGVWVTTWLRRRGFNSRQYDVLFARSTDDGMTWTYPAALNGNAGLEPGQNYRPAIATDRLGNWVAVWSSTQELGGTLGGDDDIFVARSANNGATWTFPVALNANADTDSGWDSDPRITMDGSGTWIVVWPSRENLGGTIGDDLDILFARSTDNGATWSYPATLNGNADTDHLGGEGHDFMPQAVTDGLGNWTAVWVAQTTLNGTIGRDQDLLFARSTDNGVTWSYPQALNTNAHEDSRDDRYPQVATDGLGNWIAVWWSPDDLGGTIGTDRDILFARSTDNGETWSYPAVLSYLARFDAQDDFDPYIVADRMGNWVVVWSSSMNLGGTAGTDSDIVFTHSTDVGATWSYPAVLTGSALTESNGDNQPWFATDGQGDWIAAWRSTNNLGSTIGSDPDILMAHFSLAPEVDCNYNYVLDECEVAQGLSFDCNQDGVPDECQTDFQADCNSNGVPDECDLSGETSADCNSNGVPDECDLDCDSNGVADACELVGDIDHDGFVDAADLNGYLACMTTPCASPPCVPALYTDECCVVADGDNDGDVDLSDFQGWQYVFDRVCDFDADCDDGLFCSGVEICVDSLCQRGSDPCTDPVNSFCLEDVDDCTYPPLPGMADDFENSACEQQNLDFWEDTEADGSLLQNDALFDVACLGNTKALHTASTETNVHSHYTELGSADWTSITYSGRMMNTEFTGGVGVTFMSQYPNDARYYRLRRTQWTPTYHISPSVGVEIPVGTIDTGVRPARNVWYRFSIEVTDTGTRTEIRAKVWRDGDHEPTTWQADCYDASPTRLTQGTIGVWSMGDGEKYWDDIAVIASQP